MLNTDCTTCDYIITHHNHNLHHHSHPSLKHKTKIIYQPQIELIEIIFHRNIYIYVTSTEIPKTQPKYIPIYLRIFTYFFMTPSCVSAL